MRDKIAEALVQRCIEMGHEVSSAENGVSFVFNLTDADSPQFFRRRAQDVFVFSLMTPKRRVESLRSFCYTTLVLTLSNVVLCAVPREERIDETVPDECEVYFTTPEAGFYHFPFDPERICDSLMPIAKSRFAFKNDFSTDLPERYWKTSPVIEKIMHYGKELDQLGVLPAPFPLKEVLSEESIRHIFSLFEMKGLSYGNLSAREVIPELGDTTFWMTARGIDKSRLSEVGKDVLLVRGFDYARGTALISVPPVYDPKARVSVDAVEHDLIYRTFPEVGAIVHVHAWMKNVLCTTQNFPCGTFELAEEVVNLLLRTENPSRTAVGLKNHGLTITGPSLDDIFGRIRGKLLTEVPMFT